MTSNDNLLKIANDSGFPLQIAIQHQVEQASAGHGWSVRYAEHAWSNSSQEQSGFIDLVLQNRDETAFLVVECKRVREATWLFLRQDGLNKVRRHAKAWVSHCADDGKIKIFSWEDIAIDPPSYEGQFCAVRGQSINEKNLMLERIGGDLISATEALANEERDFRANGWSARFYFNVIVTTADLKVAKFSPGDITLVDGTLANAEFEDVPFVRVRKQMLSRDARLTADDYKQRRRVSYSKESTVFIVRAESMVDFIGQFEVPEDSLRQFVFNR
jgi:hypothetical protein